MGESLRELLGELHAERVRTWPPEDLELNIRQRRELVEAFDPSKIMKLGDHLDNFEFIDVKGGNFTLGDLVKSGAAVLIIFRWATCPSCNVALPYYQRNLWPRLRELGVPLVAVSQQVPEKLIEIQTCHGLEFTVASDPGNRFSNYLGVTFSSNEDVHKWLAAKEIDLPGLLGTNSTDLPQTTALVLDEDRNIRFIDVQPDWLIRTEAEPIIDAVTALTVGASA
ncbi:peroxiredoxin-like family protein [Sphingobium fluviale]|uniref:AhpC/TSA family protein n=1 Tax=Sphingobium fluviale TaxID=2506423 RepID=A0A4Q1KFH7_9SPHN|nr:peroxiredoxin-like family protein [Sphingobium fluviale]RXR28431.1 AhpC/TSA family protein [Sphingobium fluviale]